MQIKLILSQHHIFVCSQHEILQTNLLSFSDFKFVDILLV